MSGNRNTGTTSNMEQAVSDALLGTQGMQRFDSPVRISIHSIRKRLADIDGISGKAAIDGLVHSGVLQDDSPKFVKEVRHTQEKGKTEKTVIKIEPIKEESHE